MATAARIWQNSPKPLVGRMPMEEVDAFWHRRDHLAGDCRGRRCKFWKSVEKERRPLGRAADESSASGLLAHTDPQASYRATVPVWAWVEVWTSGTCCRC